MKGKIFNAQEVQAMLNGSKVMFREVIKPQPTSHKQRLAKPLGIDALVWVDPEDIENVSGAFKSPYQVGQKIFVKESFLQKLGSTQLPSGEHETFFTGSEVEYVIDGAKERWVNPDAYYSDYWKKRLAQHMKQEHSRLTLQIKSIGVEKLGEISEEDAIKEGNVFKSDNYWHSTLHPAKGTYQCWTSAKEAFGKLWNATHKKLEEKFEANPWVWVVSFEVVNDFKKPKHTLFKGEDEFVPHKFYFCVPRELENDALELTKNTNYGVMTCRNWFGSVRGAMDRVITVKRAKNLHERPVSANVKRSIVRRMSSEIANHRLEKALKTEVINN